MEQTVAPWDGAEPEHDGLGEIDAELASARPCRSAAAAEVLLTGIIAEHADGLLLVANHHSVCFDDAHDAYQRSLEIFIRHGRCLRARTASKWLYTVTKREALRVRNARHREVQGYDAAALDEENRTADTPEERVLEEDDVRRGAEVLAALKPDYSRALLMQASGRTYTEIQALTGWSYTKVNRLIRDGRKTFLARVAALEAGEACTAWTPALAAMVAGRLKPADEEKLRPHLRNCSSCQATVRALHAGEKSLAALAPVGLLGGGVAVDPDRAVGVLTRAHDIIATHLSDRAAMGAMRAQNLLEASTATKVAAVAASAAALAGSGAVVGGVTGHLPGQTHHAHRPKPRTSAAARPRAVPPVPAVPASVIAPARRLPNQVATRRADPVVAAHRPSAAAHAVRHTVVHHHATRASAVAAEHEFAIHHDAVAAASPAPVVRHPIPSGNPTAGPANAAPTASSAPAAAPKRPSRSQSAAQQEFAP